MRPRRSYARPSGGRAGAAAVTVTKRPAYTPAHATAGLIEYQDDDGRGKTCGGALALRRPASDGLVRGVHGFLFAADAGRVIAWFTPELPRCTTLVPARRHAVFLRGIVCYVVGEENDVSSW